MVKPRVNFEMMHHDTRCLYMVTGAVCTVQVYILNMYNTIPTYITTKFTSEFGPYFVPLLYIGTGRALLEPYMLLYNYYYITRNPGYYIIKLYLHKLLFLLRSLQNPA